MIEYVHRFAAIHEKAISYTKAKAGNDINFNWSTTLNADYYRVQRSLTPQFTSYTQVGPDVAVTNTTEVGGAISPNPLVFYRVKGTNSCGAEGL